MPIVKPISGHTDCQCVFRYLTKDDRALAADYLNLDVPERDGDEPFDWAAVMDATRDRNGNGRSWGGRAARTYKHYILSPDPGDHIDLEALRGLTVEWAKRNFSDYEVAIVYHDDNARGIPHAHVVVNNTNLETGRRLQDPDPSALAHSAQEIARKRGLRDLDTDMPELDSRKRDRFRAPRTRQAVYMRRAERAIEAEGGYSWVADIRRRVGIARTIARNEAELRSVLSSMGVEVSDRSHRSGRRDWVYSMIDHPTWRVAGENLGTLYGMEAMRRRMASPYRRLSDAGERRVAEIARGAYELGDLQQLKDLAQAIDFVQREHVRDLAQLDGSSAPDEVSTFVRKAGILPERAPRASVRERKGEPQQRNGRQSGASARRRPQARDRGRGR